MTRSEIRTRILDALSENAANPRFWESSEIDEVIDEAQEILVEEISEIRRSYIVPLRPGAFWYHTQSIGPDVMVPYRLWDHTNNKRLVCITLHELDERYERWADVTGDPDVWCPISWDLFLIWPGATNGGEMLRVDCLSWPKSVEDDDEEPELPVQDHDAIVLYGIYDGLLKLWDLQTALPVFARFLERIPKGKSRSARELHDGVSKGRSATSPHFRSHVRS